MQNINSYHKIKQNDSACNKSQITSYNDDILILRACLNFAQYYFESYF